MFFFFFFNDTATTEIYTLSYTTLFRSLAEKSTYLETAYLLLHGELPTSTQLNDRSEEHTSELQSRLHLVCRLLLEKKKTSAHQAPMKATISILPSSPITTTPLHSSYMQ